MIINRKVLWSIVALGWAACSGTDRVEQRSESEQAIGQRVTQTAIAVLRVGQTTCPTGQGGWILSPAPAPPFSRFCEYTYTRLISDPPADLSALESAALEPPADADVGRVHGQSADDGMIPSPNLRTEMSAGMGPTLWALFAAHTDIPPAPPLQLSSDARPRVAIVDTMPESAPAPRSVHAPSLTAIARAIGCAQDGACPIDIVRHLAMPRVYAGAVDRVNGGYYGTLWELARAIAEAVAAHDASSQLVINLSLGWDPALSPSLPANHLDLILGPGQGVPAPERAVHAALVYARCSGALIVAASGNLHVSFQNAQGMMLPAAWNAHRSPTNGECKSMFGDDAAIHGTPVDGTRPLLYAAGGVDHLDQQLENARPGSTPDLTAPSSGVWAPGGPDVLTGTSVGTVVASMTAAMVALIRPGIGPDGALDVVRNAGTPLTLCNTQPCTSTRRISVCRAEAAACASNSDCGPLSCAPAGTPPPQVPKQMFVDAERSVLNAGGFSSVVYLPPQMTNACGTVLLPIDYEGTEVECPFSEPIATEHLDVAPQPVDPMCPVCFVARQPNGTVRLAMSLVPQIPGDRIYFPFLSVKNTAGAVAHYQLTPALMSEGYQHIFELSNPGWSLPIDSAWLDYSLNYSGAVHASGGTITVHP